MKIEWEKLKLKLRVIGLRISRLTLDKTYPKDPNPENWRTINGSKVHLTNGKIDGGAGGRFLGNTWTGNRTGGRGTSNPQKYIGPKTFPEAEGSNWKHVPSKEQMHKIEKISNALSHLKDEYIVPEHEQGRIRNRIKGMYSGVYSTRSGKALLDSLKKTLQKRNPSGSIPKNVAPQATLNHGKNGIIKPGRESLGYQNFPDAFSSKNEKANTNKAISYIHSLTQADPSTLSVYFNLGNLQKSKKSVIVHHESKGWFCAHKHSGTAMEVNYPKMPKDDDPDNLKAARMQTFFHENMHMADYCAGKGNGFYSAQHAGLVNAIDNAKVNPYPGREVQEYLRDVTTRHANLILEARKKATQDLQTEIDGLRTKYYNGDIGWYEFTKAAKSLERRRSSLTKKYQVGGLDGEDGRWGALCDLYDALFDGKVYTDNALNLKSRSGHGRKYYLSDHDNAPLEMTANWAVLRMQAPKLANMFAKDKPEVARQLDQVIAEISEVGRNAK